MEIFPSFGIIQSWDARLDSVRRTDGKVPRLPLGKSILTLERFDHNLPNPCPPPNNTVGSGTGWLRTIAPLTPGADSTITFSIHDEGDNIYDSCVILDNFQWVTSPVDGPVTIK